MPWSSYKWQFNRLKIAKKISFFSLSVKSSGFIANKLVMQTIDKEISFMYGSKVYFAGEGCRVSNPAYTLLVGLKEIS